MAAIFVIDTLPLQYWSKGPKVEAKGHLRTFYPIAGARYRVTFPPSYKRGKLTERGQVTFPPSYEGGKEKEGGKVIHLYILLHNGKI